MDIVDFALGKIGEFSGAAFVFVVIAAAIGSLFIRRNKAAKNPGEWKSGS